MQRYGTPMKARIDKRLTERGARRRHEISRGMDDEANELHPAEVRLLEHEGLLGLRTDCAGQHDDDCTRCDEIHEEHEDHPNLDGGCPLCPDWDAMADSFQER
ncbi:hypothetical protein LCGC14_0674370 [marine sediment metagenome]|uniref:Uncharacterized protein n=1 Tax=marine sediment metagenome TaxID=412755 RepID=A0A0F9QQ79_9ZZZZ